MNNNLIPQEVGNYIKSNPYQITSIQIINILLDYYSLNRIVHLFNYYYLRPYRNVTKKTKRNAFFLFRLVFLVGNLRNRVDETGNVWFFYKKSTKHDDYFACLVF